jgi:hypothetical protein
MIKLSILLSFVSKSKTRILAMLGSSKDLSLLALSGQVGAVLTRFAHQTA